MARHPRAPEPVAAHEAGDAALGAGAVTGEAAPGALEALLAARDTERGKRRGDLRRDIDSEAALDLFAGPFLLRVFAGLDTGPRWRKRAFATWWDLVKEREDR